MNGFRWQEVTWTWLLEQIKVGRSIRNPCGRCGIVGLKPTFGLVPYTGIIPMEFSLDHVGPMAKNVHDLSLLLEVCPLTYYKKNHLLTAISLFWDYFFEKKKNVITVFPHLMQVMWFCV